MKMTKRNWLIGLMAVMVMVAIHVNETRVHQQMEKNFDLACDVLSRQVSVDETNKYLKGIDLRKPVTLMDIKKGDVFIQYQVPNGPQGNFYGLQNSTPTELGISNRGYDYKTKSVVIKEKRTYMATRNFSALASYADSVVDDWSTPEIETQTEGKKLQIFTICKPCFERIH